jgi:hypothetical protein
MSKKKAAASKVTEFPSGEDEQPVEQGSEPSGRNVVSCRPIKFGYMTLYLIGDTPLIMHRWSEKAKRIMLSRQTKQPLEKTAKDPVRDFEDATYYIDEQGNDVVEDQRHVYSDFYAQVAKTKRTNEPRFGFPSSGVKRSATRGARTLGLVMTDTMGSFWVMGSMVEICGERVMREDAVPVGSGTRRTADLRYRPEFRNWWAKVEVKYNESALSVQQLVAMFNNGGTVSGLGEWRSGRGGSFGMFHVASDEEMKELIGEVKASG